MSTRFNVRCIAVSIALVSLAGLPTAAADAAAQAVAPHPDFDTSCFVLPVKANAARSEQWCTQAPRGTSIAALLRQAPESVSSGFTASTSITLGVDYRDFWLGGPTFTWYGSTTCTSTINYIGDFTPEWKNIVSSAVLSSSSGCMWFHHFDGDGQTGSSTYCGVTNHKCDGTQMNSYLMNDLSNSVRFAYA